MATFRAVNFAKKISFLQFMVEGDWAIDNHRASMTIYLVNSPKSTLAQLICFRKVIRRNSNSGKVELQGFHALNFIINIFTRGTIVVKDGSSPNSYAVEKSSS
ncbi:hypothetical protein CFP56_027244 [Quercus suber]|uniref:Uncharacterized protein n=1 Tax=Quercus suber TaxID=58331 RepID=A0AAW0JZ91_QUESU